MSRIDLTTIDENGPAERHERADAAANRALILQTAERLFAEHGVANVCMAQIAQAAGVGKGTLYRRFADKAELCLALMDSQLSAFQAETLARFQQQTLAGRSYLTQLGDFLEALVFFTDRHAPLLAEVQHGGLLRTEAPLNLPHFWQFMTVSALLRAAARNGELAPDWTSTTPAKLCWRRCRSTSSVSSAPAAVTRCRVLLPACAGWWVYWPPNQHNPWIIDVLLTGEGRSCP